MTRDESAAAQWEANVALAERKHSATFCSDGRLPRRSLPLATTGSRDTRVIQGFADAGEGANPLSLWRPDMGSELRRIAVGLAPQGVKASRSGLDRYLRAGGLTRQKRLPMPPSRTGPMSPPRGKPGASARAS